MTLTVGQSVNLVTRMEVSTIAETITVSAMPTVETTRSAVANTLGSANGREHADSRAEVRRPAHADARRQRRARPGRRFEITFAGQRGIFNNISLDGGDYNNGFFGEQVGGQRAAVDITLEAVKEFQVIANGAPAEFGRTAGGVVNVVTKSGTNEMHGNLFYFQRARRPDRRTVGRHDAREIPPRAVRRHGGRSAAARSAVLFRGGGRHRGQLRAAEPVTRDRHAVPGAVAEHQDRRSADQQQSRLSAARAARRSSTRARARTNRFRSSIRTRPRRSC